MKTKNIQEIINHLKTSGFVYQNSEIYGGVVNTWDYGPYAVAMLNAIKSFWIREFVSREKNYLLDSKIIMSPLVWKASGHLDNFSDYLIENKINNKRYRADHILKDVMPNINVEELKINELERLVKENVKEYDGSKCDWGEIKPFNLMFKTWMGAIESDNAKTYLRPETAQGIFINFKNVLRTTRAKLPFELVKSERVSEMKLHLVILFLEQENLNKWNLNSFVKKKMLINFINIELTNVKILFQC